MSLDNLNLLKGDSTYTQGKLMSSTDIHGTLVLSAVVVQVQYKNMSNHVTTTCVWHRCHRFCCVKRIRGPLTGTVL